MVIAEDYNAKIGPEDVPFTYNQETNRNGEKLLDYAEEFQLSVANTKFMKPANKLWAFQLPTGQRSQIDYIFICNKWRNSIMNCQAWSDPTLENDEYRVVACTIRLSLRQSKKPTLNPMKEVHWKYVYATPEVSSAFTLEVRNRYDAFSQPDDDIETTDNNLISITKEVALATLPKKKKVKHKPLSAHALVNEARKVVREVTQRHEKNSTRTSLKNMTRAQKQLDEACAQAEADYVEKKIDQNLPAQCLKPQHAVAWHIINALAGRKGRPSIRIKGGSAEKRKENWLSHFQSLLAGQSDTQGSMDLPLVRIAE